MNNDFSGFAEGDSGVYFPGQSVAKWNAIQAADKSKPPRQLKPKPIAEVQADLLEMATDKTNSAAERLEAYRLIITISRQMADAAYDPFAGNNSTVGDR